MVQRQGPVPARRQGQGQREGQAPVRTCVGCRTRALAGELLRVVSVDGALVLDARRRHAGRGAWLHPDPSCLDTAERRRAFPRALRVTGPLDVAGLRAQLAAWLARASTRDLPAFCRNEGSRSTRHESAVKLKP